MAQVASQSGWKETTLGNIAEIFSGSTPSTKEASYWDGSIPWITPKDLSGFDGVYISRGERNITNEGFENSSAQKLPKDTVLFSSRAPIGYIAIAANEVTTNQGFKNIVCDEQRCHSKFIYYWLINETDRIKKLSSGSTFSEASGGLMKSLQILAPSISEQRAIADVLWSIDQKIQLLKSHNKTLDATAQKLFHEWFIEFNFPNNEGKPYSKSGGKMTESTVGQIPIEWTSKSLFEVADYINGGAFKDTDFSSEKMGLPVVRIAELKNGFTSQTNYTEKELSSKYYLRDEDILFSWSGSPETSIDIFIWDKGSALLNQHIFKVVPKDEDLKTWVYFLLKHHKPFFIHRAKQKQTTGLGHITVSDRS